MKLITYINKQAKAQGITKSKMIDLLAKDSEVSRATIYNVLKGAKITSYYKIICLSDATGGAVTHKELADR